MIDPFTLIAQIHEQIFDPARLPVAALSLVIVCVGGVLIGPLAGQANPLLWKIIDSLFGAIGGRLDKTERPSSDLMTRGLILTLTAIIIGFLFGQFFQTLGHTFPPYEGVVEGAALIVVLSAGSVWFALQKLYKAVETPQGVKGAFYTISQSTRTNLAMSDEFTITRVGIGLGARVFEKGVVAPLIWYLIGGLPAAYLYAALAALSWRFGKDGFTKGFGAPALALEKLMGFVPAVFAGVLVALAGLLTPTAGMTRSLMALIPGQKGVAPYHQGGPALTAMAHALDVSLGGPTQDLDGSAIQRGWAGPEKATARLTAKHLHRALYILVMAHLLMLAALLIAMVMPGSLIFD